MAAAQAGSKEKSADGFKEYVTSLKSAVNKPMITEFGSSCSPQGGKQWYQYPGFYNNQSMSYVEAIMKICEEENVSWTKWGLRPVTIYNGGNCQQNDIENSDQLIGETSDHMGADLKHLFPKYY